MKIVICRNNNKLVYNANKEICIFSILEKEGYKHINPLDIENYSDIKWQGIEFNNLFIRHNILYRFNNWLGNHPYEKLEIEEIGTVEI